MLSVVERHIILVVDVILKREDSERCSKFQAEIRLNMFYATLETRSLVCNDGCLRAAAVERRLTLRLLRRRVASCSRCPPLPSPSDSILQNALKSSPQALPSRPIIRNSLAEKTPSIRKQRVKSKLEGRCAASHRVFISASRLVFIDRRSAARG